MSNEKKSGKARRDAPKRAPAELVVVHAGGRSYAGFTPLSIDEFDRRAGRGVFVLLFDAFELCHMSTIEGQNMNNLVSMTSVDHAYGQTNRLRVRPESWYWLREQGELTQGVYRGLYAQTVQNQSARAKALADNIAEQRKAETEAAEAVEKAMAADMNEDEPSSEETSREGEKEATEEAEQ